MIQPKSLQQRLDFFLLFPIAILLFAMGTMGFLYARSSLIAQWKEAAVLKLQRAAHQVDMRLARPKEWMQMFHKLSGSPHALIIQQSIINQLKDSPGVEQVKFSLYETLSGKPENFRPEKSDESGTPEKPGKLDITPPVYDSILDHETVSLVSDLVDETGQSIGRLEVVLDFAYLFEHILTSSWWQGDKAFLVDSKGRILTCTVPGGRTQFCETAIEHETFRAMKENPYGTVLGPGHPPREVSGFCRLIEAPWSIVIIAPGEKILSPILRLRTFYFITSTGFILLILLLIRMVTHRTVSSIKTVSRAAEQIAQGRFGPPLPVKSRDEVGELTISFNTMLGQLEERLRLKEAMDLAMEVQQNLLPPKAIKFENLEIFGKSIYCDQTGGDYFDLLQFSEMGRGRIGIAVGDVVGHGIEAALLMTTIRALLRCRVTQPGGLSHIITDVNRLLYLDTTATGSFMSLFFILIDSEQNRLRWVRAGHDPAIVYDISSDTFSELRGEGIVLGVDHTWKYKEYTYEKWLSNRIILIGTDGIWETRNPEQEIFGKDRLRRIIRQQHQERPDKIIDAVTRALDEFRRTEKQEDDITLVILKGGRTEG
ncbi:MAG: SpoIIE family protein phosphatase [Desulfobacterales bacterium]|nr:SpoIIE family protein phosphatase [Desulfobacterales bacterium]MDD4073609.1 SpoIIE family protein phosphatase [Desulfobacterales bacterium]MDD4392308.1 SpoIIE family protein phosphatase [Desulfobacterales bacterium]